MKETDKAVIQFLGYRVSEISYKCPVTLDFPKDAKVSCNMNIRDPRSGKITWQLMAYGRWSKH